MKKAELVQTVEEYLQDFARGKGYEIVDVDFVKEGANWYLRVLADKEGGFSIDDCVDTSHYLDERLENADPIDTPYILEVSSPGLDRPLKKDKDFIRETGKLVEVRLYQARSEGAFAGQKEFTALLAAADNDKQEVTLETQEGVQESFSRKELAGIRLAVIL